MKTAIEVLERSLKSHTNTRNSWASITDEDLSEDIADFDEKIDEIKAAIDYLQRKVKKDPRVDGLPPVEPNGLSLPLIIWVKDMTHPLLGKMNSVDGVWYAQDHIDYRIFSTAEILFYADPNDIL